MPKGYPTKPYTVEGVPMTSNAARLTVGNKLPDKLSDYGTRNYRVVRMKEELNQMLDLVKHSREQLTSRLKESYEDSTGLELKYLKALSELTRMFDNLTHSRIALDKAEKSLEKEMSAADERRAAMEHIMSLEPTDRGQVLKDLLQQHNAQIKTTWYKPKANPDEVLMPEDEEEVPDGFEHPDSAG